MALTDNLVAYYKLDESSGNATDSVGSFTLTNANTTYGAGKINNGGQFNGTNAVLYRDGSGSLVGISYAQFATAWTISGWINPSVVNINQVPFSIQVQSGSSQRRNARLRLVSSALKMSVYDGTANEYDTGQTLSANTWYFVTLAYTGTNFEVYLNATRVLNQARSIGVASDSQGGGFGIGADRENSGTYEPWNGKVDEVGVWTRALASGDETSLYNSGSGLAYPFSATFTLSASVGSILLTGVASTFLRGYNMISSVGSFVLTGISNILGIGYKFTCSTVAFSLTGFSSLLYYGKLLVASTGSFTLTAYDSVITSVRTMLTSVGSFTLSGFESLLLIGHTITANTATFLLTGFDSLLPIARMFLTSSTNFALTGISIIFNSARKIYAAVTTFVLSGISAALHTSGWAKQTKTSSSWSDSVKSSSTLADSSKSSSSWINRGKRQ